MVLRIGILHLGGVVQRHLPGNPKVLVFNRPGGAATVGSNYFERKAAPDGLTGIVISTSTMVSQVFGGGKAKFDVRKWRPVFVVPQDTVFYARPETGVKGKNLVDDIMALRKNGIVFGAKNATSAELRGLVTFQLLGIEKVKTTLGLSSGKQRSALMRGELTVNYDSAGSFNAKVRKHAKTGKVVPFMTLGIPQADGSVIKGPVFPNMPIALDGYRQLHDGKDPSGDVYAAWLNLVTMGVSASRGSMGSWTGTTTARVRGPPCRGRASACTGFRSPPAAASGVVAMAHCGWLHR